MSTTLHSFMDIFETEFDAGEAAKAVKAVGNGTVEEIIRKALALLMK